ncbi:MAG: peptide/nickel transport system ATP-binding protein [Thermotogaceae bacterium]|jgi:peptide/nickel transport system ATP-binding protein|nr:peptide/nickel transport system ATP-binding protein [Thermotogaceae bacterium]
MKGERRKYSIMPIVSAKNLRAYYIVDVYGFKRTVKAVDDISMEINENEILGLAGESGCGKSTLMKVLLGLVIAPLKVLNGQVIYSFNGFEKNIFELSEKELENLKWEVFSYIPQGSMNILNPTRKIGDTFFDFMEPHMEKFDKKYVREIIIQHLGNLDLPAEILESFPHQLSGGMKQRVTIALATILKPRIIFADEPTTALDVVVQRDVIQLLKNIQKNSKNTIVLVTHDMAIHANLATRIAVMYAGKIIEIAQTKDIFKNPLHPYTKYLISSLPKIGDKTYKKSIPGAPPSLANPPEGCRFHPRCPEAKKECSESVPELIELETGHKVACFRIN